MPNAMQQALPPLADAALLVPFHVASAPQPSEARDLASRLHAAFAALDADAVAELFAPDGVFEAPFTSADGLVATGREAVRARFRARWAAPRLRVEAIRELVVRESVDPALVLTEQSIVTRRIDTGAPRELSFVLAIRVRDGAIVRVSDYAAAFAPPRAGDRPPGVVITFGGRDAVLVRRYFEMWKAGDFSAADDVLDPRYVDHAYPQLVGPSAVAAVAASFRARNPGRALTVDEIVAEGDLVAARTSVRGVGEAARGLALFHVRAGKLVEQWSVNRPAPTAG